MLSETNAGVTPRGVAYTLRSVLRGSRILNAHFTGVYIPSNVGVSLSVHSNGFPKTSNDEQAVASTHVFLYVVDK